MVPRFGEHLVPSYPNIPKCMLRALNSSQLALHKRTAQMVTNFISFEDTYTALLDFVSDPFEKVMCQTDVGVRLDVSRPPEQQEALTTSYCKVALQCLVVLAHTREDPIP